MIRTAVSTIKGRTLATDHFENNLSTAALPGEVGTLKTDGTVALYVGPNPPLEVIVFPENAKLGEGIATPLVSGNTGEYFVGAPGDVYNGLLTASGMGATAGIAMTVDPATGKWKDATLPTTSGLNNSGLTLAVTSVNADVASGAGLASGINQNFANLAAEVASLRAILSIKGVTTDTFIAGVSGYYAPIRIV